MHRSQLRSRWWWRWWWGMLLVPAALVLMPVAALPPSARKDLVAIFTPKVRALGLRVTRAALVDAGNHRDAHGTHLAIYVEPTGDYTAHDYVDGIVDVTRVFLPYVFTRWNGLRSFDVCQEPSPAVDARREPAPETQVFASRAGSRTIDWSTADLATLVARSEAAASTGGTRPVAFSVFLAAHLRDSPAYQTTVGTSGSGTSTQPTTPTYG